MPALDRLDVLLGVVSNEQHVTIMVLMTHYNLPHLKNTYGCQPTLAGGAKRKPVTDYIQQAHTDLGTEKTLYVRNSETDILAAQQGRVDSGVLRRDHLADIKPQPYQRSRCRISKHWLNDWPLPYSN